MFLNFLKLYSVRLTYDPSDDSQNPPIHISLIDHFWCRRIFLELKRTHRHHYLKTKKISSWRWQILLHYSCQTELDNTINCTETALKFLTFIDYKRHHKSPPFTLFFSFFAPFIQVSYSNNIFFLWTKWSST